MARSQSTVSTSSLVAGPGRGMPIAAGLPTTGLISDLFADSRNTELSHRDALEQAKAEHDRVRQRALRVFEMHELELERQRIVKEQEKEQERLKRETQLQAEKQRLEALKAARAPTPPPLPKPKPQPKSEPKPESKEAPAAAPASPPSTVPVAPAEAKKKVVPVPVKAAETKKPDAVKPDTGFSLGSLGSSLGNATTKPAASVTPTAAAITPTPSKTASTTLFGKPLAAATATTPTSSMFGAPVTPGASLFGTKPATTPAPAPTSDAVIKADPSIFPYNDKYADIHKKLKQLRKAVEAAAAQPGSPLKGKVGDMRREIRKSMGQLTEGAGTNKIQLAKIRQVLKSSIDGTYPSPAVNVKDYVTQVPTASEGDAHTGDQLPSLYLYLLNIFSKAVINQFINECGANPKAADPIGVIFSQIFSDKDYYWRGRTLVDIMLAKLCVVCPVLFGIRGNERVPAGRVAIGWRRDEGGFISEQAHWDRMSGLGAGFGAITLRDFSKTSRTTPAPPTMYWTSMAALVNTPAAQVSGTQLVVLKAIIDGHTTRFLQFYGNAGLAALRVALVEFPKTVAKSPGQEALAVVADRLLKDEGLKLV
ncbi:hypothetical protein TD95_003462 [Thielaviopsis punctulata]|uniref:mRNA export factor GLE1 n=1 Tax=Thielaviopsis punctulata TaxID=72032 RepID=A0A0F4ZH98_9PEZI|nr:hypothetical protein TD95_003462 [Thielaviopsis punctulata]